MAILGMASSSMSVKSFDEKNEYVLLDNEEKSTYVTNDGQVITTEKRMVTARNGMRLLQTTTTSGNRVVKGYYSEDRSIMIQEYYRDNVLIRTLDLNRSSNASIPVRVTVETDLGWGFSYEKGDDKRSYSCPQYYVDDGYYDRRNIRIYKDEAESTQGEFSEAVYLIQDAEKDLNRAVGNASYSMIIEALGEIISASYGDVVDAVMGVKDFFDSLEEGKDIIDLGEIMAENGAGMFILYDELASYDHLS